MDTTKMMYFWVKPAFWSFHEVAAVHQTYNSFHLTLLCTCASCHIRQQQFHFENTKSVQNNEMYKNCLSFVCIHSIESFTANLNIQDELHSVAFPFFSIHIFLFFFFLVQIKCVSEIKRRTKKETWFVWCYSHWKRFIFLLLHWHTHAHISFSICKR